MDAPLLALDVTTAVLVAVAVLCLAVLVLIVIGPWKKVRQEPRLDPDVEAKLLLRRNPDEPTAEIPIRKVPDLDEGADGADRGRGAGYDELRNL
jgi:hypothetical protein